MQALFKKITVPFMLATFMFAAFFGFTAMSYGPDGQMQGDCPFSAAGAPQCPQDSVAAAIHHLSAYQSFLNVPIDSGFSMLAIMLGLIGIALLLVASSPPLLVPTASPGALYKSPPLVSHTEKLIRWLSLFENSPSIV